LAPTPASTATEALLEKESLALLLGGPRNEWFASSVETSDGGLVLAGATNSPKFGSELDAYVVRLDPDGHILWQESYGGTADDGVTTVLELADGDLLLLGYTLSFGKGAQDGWAVRLTPDGAVRWQKSYGGSGDDVFFAGLETAGGQTIAAGHTSSFGKGGYDSWIVCISAQGELVWQKTYGGKDNDRFSAIAPAGDGWLVAGATSSFGAGDADLSVVRLGSDGAVVWQKAIGGQASDYASSILPTEDGGWLVSGSTTSSGAGDYDAWVGAFTAQGELIWQKTYGGAADDFAEVLAAAPEGGFTFLGETHNAGQGGSDAWLLSAGSDGEPRWQKTFGDQDDDSVDALMATSDGGYVLAGWTESYNSQGPDAWALKVDGEGNAADCRAVLSVKLDDRMGHLANVPAEGMLMPARADTLDTKIQQHDAGLDDRALCAPAANASADPPADLDVTWSLEFPQSEKYSGVTVRDAVSLPDGGFLLAGDITKGPGWPGKADIWLARLDANGKELWQQAYGTAEGSESATAVNLARDGSFLVAGYSSGQRFYLLRVDENGKLLWNRSVPSQNAPTGAAVAETPDGAILLAGSSTAYVYRLWRFSASGELEWRFGGRLESQDGDRWTFSSLALKALDTGGYYLAGGAASQNSNDNILAVIGLDGSGNALWQRGYGLAPAAKNQPIAFEALPGGGFVAAGIQNDLAESEPWVLRAEEDGTPVWAMTLAMDDLVDVALMPDRLVLVGSNEEGVLAEALDLDGTPLWQSVFKRGENGSAEASAVAVAPDGGALLVGNTSVSGKPGTSVFALRLDSEGGLAGCGAVQPLHLTETNLDMSTRLRSGLVAGTSNLEDEVDKQLLTARLLSSSAEPFCPAMSLP
jgi:uncharacterized delta-60 repeat protein